MGRWFHRCARPAAPRAESLSHFAEARNRITAILKPRAWPRFGVALASV
jgi:hypothetical protein